MFFCFSISNKRPRLLLWNLFLLPRARECFRCAVHTWDCCRLFYSVCVCVCVDAMMSEDQDRAAGERSSLSGLLLASHAPLDDAQRAGRMKCSRCGASRMFYCYSCCALVGLEPRDVPSVKLPVKIDIIKHPNEVDGKSTAVQARLIAPQDVTIYTYPCIPELDQSAENIVVVFPGPNAMTVEELWEYFTAGGAQRAKRLKAASETHTCPIQRVVFIDSTWNQTTRIITDERLQALPHVELKSRRTCFWRRQKGCPDTHLATIEAVYYFLKDLHSHYYCEYTGEYDNLLFFFSFLHKLINKAKQAAGKV